jgi:hypothetical protein
MCIITIIILFLIVIFSTGLLVRNYNDKAGENAGIFIDLIEGGRPIKSSIGVGFEVEGLYKGRKVRLNRSHSDNINRYFYVEMEVRFNPGGQKLFMINYPRPTKNTILKGNSLIYKDKFILFGGPTTYTKEEYSRILEELSEAAQKVEAGQIN